MMRTTYFEIIEMVLLIVKSYEADIIFDDYGIDGIMQLLKPYFKLAGAKLKIQSPSMDFSRDDELLQFNRNLDDSEQLIFAEYVLVYYLSKEVKDILQMQLHLQDGDFKTHAAKNNLESKSNLLESLKEEVGWEVNKTGFNRTNIWRGI